MFHLSVLLSGVMILLAFLICGIVCYQLRTKKITAWSTSTLPRKRRPVESSWNGSARYTTGSNNNGSRRHESYIEIHNFTTVWFIRHVARSDSLVQAIFVLSQALLGSRRWNWKCREKHFWNPKPELLLHSSYSFWPKLSTSGSCWNLASTLPWKNCEKHFL